LGTRRKKDLRGGTKKPLGKLRAELLKGGKILGRARKPVELPVFEVVKENSSAAPFWLDFLNLTIIETLQRSNAPTLRGEECV